MRRILFSWRGLNIYSYPAMLYVGACLLSKRLHDRGRSGWLAALILLALTAIWAPPTNAFDFVFLLVLVWTVVELSIRGVRAVRSTSDCASRNSIQSP